MKQIRKCADCEHKDGCRLREARKAMEKMGKHLTCSEFKHEKPCCPTCGGTGKAK